MGATVQIGPSPADEARWELEEKWRMTQKANEMAENMGMSVIQLGYASFFNNNSNFVKCQSFKNVGDPLSHTF